MPLTPIRGILAPATGVETALQKGQAVRDATLSGIREEAERAGLRREIVDEDFARIDRLNNFDDDLESSRFNSQEGRLQSEADFNSFGARQRRLEKENELKDLTGRNRLAAELAKNDVVRALGNIEAPSGNPFQRAVQLVDAINSPDGNFTPLGKNLAFQRASETFQPLVKEYERIAGTRNIADFNPEQREIIVEELRTKVGEENLANMIRLGILPEGSFNPFDVNSRVQDAARQSGSVAPTDIPNATNVSVSGQNPNLQEEIANATPSTPPPAPVKVKTKTTTDADGNQTVVEEREEELPSNPTPTPSIDDPNAVTPVQPLDAERAASLTQESVSTELEDIKRELFTRSMEEIRRGFDEKFGAPVTDLDFAQRESLLEPFVRIRDELDEFEVQVRFEFEDMINRLELLDNGFETPQLEQLEDQIVELIETIEDPVLKEELTSRLLEVLSRDVEGLDNEAESLEQLGARPNPSNESSGGGGF